MTHHLFNDDSVVLVDVVGFRGAVIVSLLEAEALREDGGVFVSYTVENDNGEGDVTVEDIH